VETQSRMVLYTSDTENEICEDWKEKILFYSPKISTGVDVTVLDQTEQFLYFTGKSVSSITLYQMATRTRNMSQLSYYSCCNCFEAKYENIDVCWKQISLEYVANIMGISSCTLDDDIREDIVEKEDIYKNIYVENTYVLDYYKTYTLKFFENELRSAGFKIVKKAEESAKLNEEVKEQMKVISNEITDEKFELLINSLNSEDSVPGGINQMKKRVELLNLDSAELVEEYRDLIEDEHKFEHFLNYNRLNKSYEDCQIKLNEAVNDKMLHGIQANVWNKIKYVHMLAKTCGIEKDLFDLKGIVCPDIKDKKIQLLIDSIKVLYRKRDNIDAKDYTSDEFIKLYKFMLESLVKNLGIIVSKKNSKKCGRHSYNVDDEVKARYDKLISIMNPPKVITIDCMDEE
jgi:hypothetical protein